MLVGCECQDPYDNYGMCERNSFSSSEDGTEETMVMEKQNQFILDLMTTNFIYYFKRRGVPKKNPTEKGRHKMNPCSGDLTQSRNITYVH